MWGLSLGFSASPGVISVKPGGVIDREALPDPLLEFMLVARDIGGLNSTARLTVTVLDDNDNHPIFQPMSVTAWLRENSPPGEDRDDICMPPWDPEETASNLQDLAGLRLKGKFGNGLPMLLGGISLGWGLVAAVLHPLP